MVLKKNSGLNIHILRHMYRNVYTTAIYNVHDDDDDVNSWVTEDSYHRQAYHLSNANADKDQASRKSCMTSSRSQITWLWIDYFWGNDEKEWTKKKRFPIDILGVVFLLLINIPGKWISSGCIQKVYKVVRASARSRAKVRELTRQNVCFVQLHLPYFFSFAVIIISNQSKAKIEMNMLLIRSVGRSEPSLHWTLGACNIFL